MKEDIGLLILRLSFGGVMFFAHGIGKVDALLGPEPASPFFALLGLSAGFGLFLTALAETLFALTIVIGIFTRISAIILASVMFVAAFIAHAGHGFAKQELAIMYMVGYISIALLGEGNLSLKAYLKQVKKDRA